MVPYLKVIFFPAIGLKLAKNRIIEVALRSFKLPLNVIIYQLIINQ